MTADSGHRPDPQVPKPGPAIAGVLIGALSVAAVWICTAYPNLGTPLAVGLSILALGHTIFR